MTFETVIHSFLAKDLPLQSLRRFLARESVMMSDSMNRRIKKALTLDIAQPRSGGITCKFYTDEEFRLYQEDTLFYFKILFVKQPSLKSVHQIDSSNATVVERYLLTTVRYEIIFMDLPEDLRQFLTCITNVTIKQISDDIISTNAIISEAQESTAEENPSTLCYTQLSTDLDSFITTTSEETVTPSIWKNFTVSTKKAAIEKFLEQQRRKIDYLLGITKGRVVDHLKFVEKCRTNDRMMG